MEEIQWEKTCCFTGHRPKFFPFGGNICDPAAAKMLRVLESEILQAVADGYTIFLYGGALGVDTWAAEIVQRLRKNLPLTLIAVLPFPGYNADVTDAVYRRVIEKSDRIIYVDTERRMSALAARDRYMIDHSSRLIAVYDERSHLRSGTRRALCYAIERQLDIHRIRWMDYL